MLLPNCACKIYLKEIFWILCIYQLYVLNAANFYEESQSSFSINLTDRFSREEVRIINRMKTISNQTFGALTKPISFNLNQILMNVSVKA